MRSDASARAGLVAAVTSRPRPALRSPPRRSVAATALLPGAVGVFALAVIVVGTLGTVLVASAGPTVLVPRSGITFPGWEAGPLRHLIASPHLSPIGVGDRFTIILGGLLVAYLVAVLCARRLPLAVLAGVVVLLHVVLLLGPPLQLNDVFNYLGYARLGALHSLSPYTHVMSDESLDPVFRFASWDGLRSPYGELFTLLSYPLAFLSLATAYWVLKAVIVLLSLAFLWLVCECARRLGRDARPVLAFVALNPIYLIYAVGGFHNDFVMLVPSTAAIAFGLARRDRSAGAALALAFAVKFTAIIIGPFLLVMLATRVRIRRFVLGAVLAIVPVVVVSVVLFGTSLPNLAQQSSLLSNFDLPNLAGLPFGVGGSPLVLHLASLTVVLTAAFQLLRRRIDPLAGAGWVTFALILSLSWEVPWYAIWLLPLAALSRRPALRVAALALTVYLIISFTPVTSQYLNDHRVGLLATPAGHASRSLQERLAG